MSFDFKAGCFWTLAALAFGCLSLFSPLILFSTLNAAPGETSDAYTTSARHYNAAHAFIKSQQWSKALEQLADAETALKKTEASASNLSLRHLRFAILYGRGFVYAHQQKWREATFAFQEAVLLNDIGDSEMQNHAEENLQWVEKRWNETLLPDDAHWSRMVQEAQSLGDPRPEGKLADIHHQSASLRAAIERIRVEDVAIEAEHQKDLPSPPEIETKWKSAEQWKVVTMQRREERREDRQEESPTSQALGPFDFFSSEMAAEDTAKNRDQEKSAFQVISVSHLSVPYLSRQAYNVYDRKTGRWQRKSPIAWETRRPRPDQERSMIMIQFSNEATARISLPGVPTTHRIDPQSFRFEDTKITQVRLQVDRLGNAWIELNAAPQAGSGMVYDLFKTESVETSSREGNDPPWIDEPGPEDLSTLDLPDAYRRKVAPFFAETAEPFMAALRFVEMLHNEGLYTSDDSKMDDYLNAKGGASKFERLVSVFMQSEEVLNNEDLKGKGMDCDCWADLAAVTLRSQGIPARLLRVYVHDGSVHDGRSIIDPLAQRHALIQVWNKSAQKWIEMDPTPMKSHRWAALEPMALAMRFREMAEKIQEEWRDRLAGLLSEESRQRAGGRDRFEVLKEALLASIHQHLESVPESVKAIPEILREVYFHDLALLELVAPYLTEREAMAADALIHRMGQALKELKLSSDDRPLLARRVNGRHRLNYAEGRVFIQNDSDFGWKEYGSYVDDPPKAIPYLWPGYLPLGHDGFHDRPSYFSLHTATNILLRSNGRAWCLPAKIVLLTSEPHSWVSNPRSGAQSSRNIMVEREDVYIYFSDRPAMKLSDSTQMKDMWSRLKVELLTVWPEFNNLIVVTAKIVNERGFPQSQVLEIFNEEGRSLRVFRDLPLTPLDIPSFLKEGGMKRAEPLIKNNEHIDVKLEDLQLKLILPRDEFHKRAEAILQKESVRDVELFFLWRNAVAHRTHDGPRTFMDTKLISFLARSSDSLRRLDLTPYEKTQAIVGLAEVPGADLRSLAALARDLHVDRAVWERWAKPEFMGLRPDLGDADARALLLNIFRPPVGAHDL